MLSPPPPVELELATVALSYCASSAQSCTVMTELPHLSFSGTTPIRVDINKNRPMKTPTKTPRDVGYALVFGSEDDFEQMRLIVASFCCTECKVSASLKGGVCFLAMP